MKDQKNISDSDAFPFSKCPETKNAENTGSDDYVRSLKTGIRAWVLSLSLVSVATPTFSQSTAPTRENDPEKKLLQQKRTNNIMPMVLMLILDSTPPATLTAPYISAGPTDTTASVNVKISTNGTGHYLVLPAIGPIPSAANVLGWSSVPMSAGVMATINLVGLSPQTDYVFYFIAENSAHEAQATISALPFRTPDTLPNQFAFPAKTDVERSTSVCSAISILSGFDTVSPVVAVGGTVKVNGGAEITNGNVLPGQNISACLVSSANFGTKKSVDVTVGTVNGGVKGTFDVTTIAADTTPNPFSIPTQTGVSLNSYITSAPFLITGTNAPAPISIVWGSYSFDGINFTTADGFVPVNPNGQSVYVRLLSANAYSTPTAAFVSIGGVNAFFLVTTESEPAITTPNPFPFTAINGASLSSTITSAPVTITWPNTAVPITVSGSAGAKYNVNGGAFTAVAGMINANDQIRAQVTSAASNLGTTYVDVTVGGVTQRFNVTTLALVAPVVPTGFALNVGDYTNQQPFLTWDAVPLATTYEIMIDEADGGTWSDIGNVTSYQTSGLTDTGKTHTFAIRAKNAAGTSSPTNTLRTTIDVVPVNSMDWGGVVPDEGGITYVNLILHGDKPNSFTGATGISLVSTADTQTIIHVSAVSVDADGQLVITYTMPNGIPFDTLVLSGYDRFGNPFGGRNQQGQPNNIFLNVEVVF